MNDANMQHTAVIKPDTGIRKPNKITSLRILLNYRA